MRSYTFAGVIAALFISFSARAQNPQEIPVRYDGTDRTGVAAEYAFDKDFTEHALEARLGAAGLPRKSRKNGFTYYKEATWTAVTTDKVDIYFKVTGNSSKSAISVLVAKGYDNFVTSATDAQTIQNVKNFLNSLQQDIEAYQKQVVLNEQQKKVAEAQKDAERSSRDAERAAKKQERELRQREKDQRALEKEQQKMQQMKNGSN